MAPEPSVSEIRPLERGPTVARQVAEHLARLIAEGTLAPGERLPGEVALARRLGVSRPTLREALSLLEEKGVLEIRPRSGTYVRELEAPEERDLLGHVLPLEPNRIWELLEARRLIAPGVAALAARRRSEADLEPMRELARRVSAASGEELVRDGELVRDYSRFFAMVIAAGGNDLMVYLSKEVGGALRDGLLFGRLHLLERPGTMLELREQCLAMLAAIEAQDEQGAYRATLEHLEYLEAVLREAEEEAWKPPPEETAGERDGDGAAGRVDAEDELEAAVRCLAGKTPPEPGAGEAQAT